jgi:hypothetical protein
MGWVEVYNYNLGFCVLCVITNDPCLMELIQMIKYMYTMVAYRMNKTKIVYPEINQKWHTESH